MTDKIREYKMNGSLIIGVDAGYGNYKTARRVFPTAITASEKPPVLAKDYIEMDGKYYIIGEGHKGFVADKVTDDDNYVLTMAAAAENLKDFKGMNLVVDIGNGTMNLMYLNNGRAMESRSWTEKLGVFQCEKNIRNKVRDNTGNELMREVIDNFLRTGETDIVEPYASLMKEAATEYADIVFQKLYDYEKMSLASMSLANIDIRRKNHGADRRREYNEQMMKLHFIGGGARIIESYGSYNKDRVFFNHDIRANAKDYEYYCYMILRHEQGKRAM